MTTHIIRLACGFVAVSLFMLVHELFTSQNPLLAIAILIATLIVGYIIGFLIDVLANIRDN